MAAPSPGRKRDARRYGTTTIRIKDLKVCHYCGTSPLADTIVYCPSCGFPQRGSEGEQKVFLVNRKRLGTNANETEADIGIGRIILFALGLLFGGIAAYHFYHQHALDGWTNASIAAVFIGLGIWAAVKPYPALLTGLIVFGTLLLVMAAINPLTILSGLVLKIGIIASLVYGITAVKKAENLRKQLEIKKMDISAVDENTPGEPNA